jgi:hypothetical protein
MDPTGSTGLGFYGQGRHGGNKIKRKKGKGRRHVRNGM